MAGILSFWASTARLRNGFAFVHFLAMDRAIMNGGADIPCLSTHFASGDPSLNGGSFPHGFLPS